MKKMAVFIIVMLLALPFVAVSAKEATPVNAVTVQAVESPENLISGTTQGILNSEGVVVSNRDYATSNFIRLEKMKFYYVNTVNYICGYDASHNFVAGINSGDNEQLRLVGKVDLGTLFMLPNTSDIAYVKVSFNTIRQPYGSRMLFKSSLNYEQDSALLDLNNLCISGDTEEYYYQDNISGDPDYIMFTSKVYAGDKLTFGKGFNVCKYYSLNTYEQQNYTNVQDMSYWGVFASSVNHNVGYGYEYTIEQDCFLVVWFRYVSPQYNTLNISVNLGSGYYKDVYKNLLAGTGAVNVELKLTRNAGVDTDFTHLFLDNANKIDKPLTISQTSEVFNARDFVKNNGVEIIYGFRSFYYIYMVNATYEWQSVPLTLQNAEGETVYNGTAQMRRATTTIPTTPEVPTEDPPEDNDDTPISLWWVFGGVAAVCVLALIVLKYRRGK